MLTDSTVAALPSMAMSTCASLCLTKDMRFPLSRFPQENPQRTLPPISRWYRKWQDQASAYRYSCCPWRWNGRGPWRICRSHLHAGHQMRTDSYYLSGGSGFICRRQGLPSTCLRAKTSSAPSGNHLSYCATRSSSFHCLVKFSWTAAPKP